MRLTGYAAIEFAEKRNLRLNKHPSRIEPGACGLTVAEAAAVAAEDETRIYLDIPDEEYFCEPPITPLPER